MVIWKHRNKSTIYYEDSADLLFDRADADSRLIAGGHFFARPSAGSAAFFAKLSNDLSEHYTSDNGQLSS